jgi:NAD(P)-dependent dehydrogenase (short-subunit alcohol dehydrogenase family)
MPNHIYGKVEVQLGTVCRGHEMAKLCEGRVAVVTGAGRGIGREYALMLAAHGANVVVNDLGGGADGIGTDTSPAQQVVSEICRAGGRAVADGHDVSSWSGSKAMIDAAINEFGRLDVLVNNAGILRDRMLVNMQEAEWDDVMNVHLKGTFAPTHHAAVYWRDRSKQTGVTLDARVINTSSVSGIYGNIGQCNYGAAKAGIAAFTVIASRELSRYGVTVNAIAPVANTRLTENLREYTEEEKLRRDPRWIAPVVTWLASTKSSSVTGRVIEAGNGIVAIAEGWHRGPQIEQIAHPAEVGAALIDMVARARKNAGINGADLD